MSARDYQRAAIDALFAYWGEGGGNPLVDMATGTGKSVVISTLIKESLQLWPDLRILALVHVKELVEQNAKALLRTWPGAPIGINSAGLGRRDRLSQVLFASIQSVHKQDGYSLGPRDLVLIDEAHLTPRDGQGMYRKLLERLRERVPDMRVAGFTATPYRLDSGRLDEGEGRLFDEVVYTYGIGDGVRDGWLAPLVSKGTKSEVDVSGVARRGGEFVAGDLERAVDRSEIVEAAADEMVARGQDRRSWIAFCAGVAHAESVRNALRRRGIACEMVTGDTPGPERDRILVDFKAGRIRCLTNAMVLTTGFDAPGVDLIAMLRPTLSTGLYVQKLGRGTRPVFPAGLDPNAATAEERKEAIATGTKPDCLVLDFAGNVRRHGPVDAITVTGGPKSKEAAEDERVGAVRVDDVRAKPCPTCETLVAVQALTCNMCGHRFPEPEIKHEKVADDTPVMLGAAPRDTWTPVGMIGFYRHQKFNEPDKPPTLRVEYVCGLLTHKEWVCFEHEGFARKKADAWWRKMAGASDAAVPASVDEALDRIDAGEIRLASSIVVRPRGSFVDVLGHRFDGDPPSRLRPEPRFQERQQDTRIYRRVRTDCWSVLGIPGSSSVDEVKATFRRLARERHPDMGGTHDAMTALNAAYQEALVDAELNEVPF